MRAHLGTESPSIRIRRASSWRFCVSVWQYLSGSGGTGRNFCGGASQCLVSSRFFEFKCFVAGCTGMGSCCVPGWKAVTPHGHVRLRMICLLARRYHFRINKFLEKCQGTLTFGCSWLFFLLHYYLDSLHVFFWGGACGTAQAFADVHCALGFLIVLVFHMCFFVFAIFLLIFICFPSAGLQRNYCLLSNALQLEILACFVLLCFLWSFLHHFVFGTIFV